MKKLLKIVLAIGLTISAVLIFVFCNLKSNSVYYAKHIPKGDKQYPEIMMLIDDLDWLYKPEIEGLRYGLDGMHDIINDRKGDEQIFGNSHIDNIRYIYIDKLRVFYRLDKNLKVADAVDLTNYTDIDITTIDQDRVISEIKELLQPVIDAQREPFPNLQWVFNWLNQDRYK